MKAASVFNSEGHPRVLSSLTLAQAQRVRRELREAGYEKTGQGMERGRVWTRWAKDLWLVFVEMTYTSHGAAGGAFIPPHARRYLVQATKLGGTR